MKRMIAACLGLVLIGSISGAQAEIVQGQLELRWGDPVPAPAGAQKAARFVATLVTDDGKRLALDPVQARRGAGDLYALANRRVAVDFSRSKRGGARVIEAIVAADRPWLGVSAKALVTPKAVIGNTRWVTIACKFSDMVDEQKPVSFFQGQYGMSPGQLGHYWQEVSYGKINLTGSTAVGWFTLPQPRSHYVTMVDGKEKANLDLLFENCAAAADPQVDFNGVQGINMMFNGDLDGFAWGGTACGPLEGANKCIRNTWNPPWAFNNLAPLAHEMGHGYGLPHSDNSDADSDTYDNPWDVMSDGWRNATHSVDYGTLPKHINIQQRDRLGWVDAARKLTIPPTGSARDIVLDRASLVGSGNLQMVVAQADAAGAVIFTLEVRKRTGDYEAQLAGNAVIIHKLTNGGTAFSADADRPPANVANNEGSMFKVGETWIAPDNTHMVKVKAETPNGFVITVARPRVTGGALPSRTRPAAAAPVPVPVSVPAPQRTQATQPRSTRSVDCAASLSVRGEARCQTKRLR